MTVRQPIACWELNNALTDATGGGKTLVNATGSYVTGKVGSHARRTSAAASQTNAAFSAIADTEWSVSLWFKWTFVDGDFAGIVLRLSTSGSEDGTSFTLDTHDVNSIEFVSTSGAVIQDITAWATINDWNHAVVTWDGGTVKLYLNGVLRANGSDGPAGFGSDPGLLLEIGLSNFDFDQLAIWDEVIPEAEAVELYNSGAGLVYANPWSSATAPGAIADLAAVATADGADLTWTDPADGGSAITEIKAFWRATSGIEADQTGASSSGDIGTGVEEYTITGLSAGTYYVAVRVTNAVGATWSNEESFEVEAVGGLVNSQRTGIYYGYGY